MEHCELTDTPSRSASVQSYRVRLAESRADLISAQRLRFEVFNLELCEGLPESFNQGLDVDPFDSVCDHLLVEEVATGRTVGTYRLQTGERAQRNLGYYSEREFDFQPLEVLRPQLLELGRACIDAQHRSFPVLNLLWTGIARYAKAHGQRYLVGCSSLNLQDETLGAAAYHQMAEHWADTRWRTEPRAGFVCSMDVVAEKAPKIPRLLSAYLALGAEICGPPAIDREFGSIDFLTMVDLRSPAIMAVQLRGRFGGGSVSG